MLVFRCLVCLSAAAVLAAGPPPDRHIGVAVAPGVFELDRAAVSGNATVFDGSLLRAGKSAADVTLTTGPRIRLGSGAEASIYRERLVLARGAARVQAGAPYAVESLGLRLLPASGLAAVARGSTVEVAALGAPVRVTTRAGLAVATVPAGKAVSLQQAEAAATEKLTGVLRFENAHYLLTDEVSNTTVELAGADLSKHIGARISVTGTIDASATAVQGAAHVVRVVSLSAAAAAGGVSGAVVAGIVVAAGGATAATVGVLASGDGEPAKLSR